MGQKIIKGRKVRMDTTAAELKFFYLSDTSLLTGSMWMITLSVARLKGLGAEVGVGFVDHTCKVKKVFLGLSKVLKGRIDRGNPRLVKDKEEVLKPAEVKRLVERPGGWLGATEKIVEETKAVLGGRLHLRVKCYSGHTYAQRPGSFLREDVEYKVRGIEKEWAEPGEKHFLVCTEDNKRFELWYNEPEDEWSIREIAEG